MTRKIEVKKMGRILSAEQLPFEWADSYTQCPTALICEDFLRIYFNTRSKQDCDGNFISSITYIDVDKENPMHIISIAKEPVLGPGKVGCFDHFGVGVSSILRLKGAIYLYYSGWQRCTDVPYTQAVGVAISNDNGKTFQRKFEGPIIAPNKYDPYLVTTPTVFIKDKLFHCIYMAGIDWIKHRGKLESIYVLKYAKSQDGINWNRTPSPIIKQSSKNECMAVPSAFCIGDQVHLFFSTRPGLDFRNKENGYRMAYAHSQDVGKWKRNDNKISMTVSDSGWDSEMICYPNICKVGDKIYMFYCGNYFGRDGFGYAEVIM